MRGECALNGEFLADGGTGTSRAGIGEALTALREGSIGDAVAERGRGMARAAIGDAWGD